MVDECVLSVLFKMGLKQQQVRQTRFAEMLPLPKRRQT